MTLCVCLKIKATSKQKEYVQYKEYSVNIFIIQFVEIYKSELKIQEKRWGREE
jgi:hypothetical protein